MSKLLVFIRCGTYPLIFLKKLLLLLGITECLKHLIVLRVRLKVKDVLNEKRCKIELQKKF